ncbi:hypothetical protein EXU30_16390 [Shewanella maritima]|uniref:EF-hand domain-containing protein n=1 Tax=Shewanella maritima TaxID=2520507 RepID=A0A411PKN2_9GAMM|nr:hypothetical protein [Shewanella maritima]QBF84077.1 hypothetical protein EXU30_16390 [Shewanella maritima]
MKKFKFTFVILFAALGMYIYSIVTAPIPYSVIDQDNSGIVSLDEISELTNLKVRTLIKTGEICRQYYWQHPDDTVHQVCEPSTASN